MTTSRASLEPDRFLHLSKPKRQAAGALGFVFDSHKVAEHSQFSVALACLFTVCAQFFCFAYFGFSKSPDSYAGADFVDLEGFSVSKPKRRFMLAPVHSLLRPSVSIFLQAGMSIQVLSRARSYIRQSLQIPKCVNRLKYFR